MSNAIAVTKAKQGSVSFSNKSIVVYEKKRINMSIYC